MIRCDLAAGADGHGRLGHDHRVAVERARDLLGGREDVGEVGMAVAAPARRADRDEDGVGSRTAAARSVVKVSRPAARCVATSCRGPARRSASRPASAARSSRPPCRRRPRRRRTPRSRRRIRARHSRCRSSRCALRSPSPLGGHARRIQPSRSAPASGSRRPRRCRPGLEEAELVAAVEAPPSKRRPWNGRSRSSPPSRR